MVHFTCSSNNSASSGETRMLSLQTPTWSERVSLYMDREVATAAARQLSRQTFWRHQYPCREQMNPSSSGAIHAQTKNIPGKISWWSQSAGTRLRASACHDQTGFDDATAYATAELALASITRAS